MNKKIKRSGSPRHCTYPEQQFNETRNNNKNAKKHKTNKKITEYIKPKLKKTLVQKSVTVSRVHRQDQGKLHQANEKAVSCVFMMLQTTSMHLSETKRKQSGRKERK